MTGASARVLAAALMTALGVPVVGVGHADACPGRAVGRWAPLASTPGGPARQVVPLRSRCALLAVSPTGGLARSADGRSWSAVRTPPVSRLLAAGRTPAVLAATTAGGGGLLVSRDDGRTFAAAAPAAPVVALPAAPVAGAVSWADAATLLVAVPTPAPAGVPGGTAAVTTLWRSTDGGRTLAPYGTVPAPVTALAYDAGSADVVWLAAATTAGAGLWRSADGGASWTRAVDGAVYDVDTAPRAARGLVVAAKDDGVWSSTDGGATWARTPTRAVRGVRVDNGGPGAVALAGSAPLRLFPGARPGPLVAGLPPHCAAAALAADGGLPVTFTVRCGGRWYVLVSAADLSGPGGGPRPGGAVPASPGLPLKELLRLPLPSPDGADSGSLAFDGRALYYAGAFDGPAPDTVHLMSPVDGRPLGTLAPGIPAKLLTYDSRHDRLYVDDGTAMWRVDPGAGAAALAFPSTYGFQHSYDASTRTFVGVSESGALRVLNESGTIAAGCSLETALASVVTARRDPSAVVAATDGAYVVLEDDTTIVRIGRDCRLQATYLTRVFSESTLENDELVCDPLTFAPSTALWIRDSALDSVTAYDLPEGYCPFVSALRVSVPRLLPAGARGRACATLTSAARGWPVPGQAVSLDVDGIHVGAPPTDAAGRTCAALPPGLAPGRARVRARYAGTPQWAPAAATAVTTVGAAPVRHPRPPAGPVLAPVAPGPAVVVAPAADPPGPPNAPAEPVPGHQPQAQGNAQQHAAQQPGVQAGVAPGEDDEPALVLAGAEDERGTSYAMSRTPAAAAVLLAGAAVLTAAAGWGIRHQQTSAPAWVRAGRGRSRTAGRRGHAVRGGRR